MIKRFKIFEQYNEIDPYGEDDWGEDDLIYLDEITYKTIFKLGDEIYDFEQDYIGTVVNIIYNEGLYNKVLFVDTINKYNQFSRRTSIAVLTIFGYKIRHKKINESYNELDPYSEENWLDDIYEPINNSTEIKIGDEIYTENYEYYGVIEEVFIGDMGRTFFYKINRRDKTTSRTKDNLKHYGFKIKKKEQNVKNI